MTAAEWIKLNLPPETSFSRNGVTITVDDAVEDALDSFSQHTEAAQKRYALAELIGFWLGAFVADKEIEDEYTRDGVYKMWEDRRQRWIKEAQDISGEDDPTEGGWSSVPVRLTPESCSDENSSQ